MAKSIKSHPSRKAVKRPGKPHPKFPLFAHALGYWSAKVNGRLRHFGRWGRVENGKLVPAEGGGDWREAWELYNQTIPSLKAGDDNGGTVVRSEEDSPAADVLTLRGLCELFMQAKHQRLQAGELGQRMFLDYQEVANLAAEVLGRARPADSLKPADFGRLRSEFTRRWGPVRVKNTITRVRSVFLWGYKNGHLDRPANFGTEFDPPTPKVLRLERAKNGDRTVEADMVRNLVKSAPTPLKAMILLAVNCGFGNADLGALPLSAIDLDGGWVSFPRPKTGIGRRCPLWPETAAAVREAMAVRPTPAKGCEQLVFVNARGHSFVRVTGKSRTDCIAVAFKNLCDGVKGANGIGLYDLRRTFRTIADGARDSVACDVIMGHSDPTMGGLYRQRVEDSRLQAVTDHVRNWYLGTAT